MGLLSSLSRSGSDIAIDLGTANTLIYVKGFGIVVSEPSVVAVDSRTSEVHAVGDEARRMIGRTPATIRATRPLRHGVIAEVEVAEEMLRYFVGKVHGTRWAHPRVVMCVPSSITGIEISAVEEACLSAGAREVHLIEEPIAAAIGDGLDISEPTGHMVVDIGGGTSDVAMLTMGQMVAHRSIPVGGYDFDDALTALLRRDHELVIGQPTAEALKLAVGSAAPLGEELVAEVRGRQASSGLPTGVTVGSEVVRNALADPLETIIQAVRETLDEAPPELAGDIINHGILMAGGGSLLRGFPERLNEETQMPTYLAESPLTCVAVGAGRSLEELDTMSRSRRATGDARRGHGGPFKSRSGASGSRHTLSRPLGP